MFRGSADRCEQRRRALPEPGAPPTPEQIDQLTAAAAEQGIELIGPPGSHP
jgi:hypothetical protein